MAEINHVEYVLPVFGRVLIERLHRVDQVKPEHAAGALALLATIYAQQFEEPDGSFRPGTFYEHFDPDNPLRIMNQVIRMTTAIKEKGSQYFMVPHLASPEDKKLDTDVIDEENPEYSGLIKVTPSKDTEAQKHDEQPANMFVNDILVAPKLQKHLLGSALLDAAANYAGYDPAQRVALHSFDQAQWSPAWFEYLALAKQRKLYRKNEKYRVGSRVLQQTLYASAKGETIGTLAGRLREEAPYLKAALPIYS